MGLDGCFRAQSDIAVCNAIQFLSIKFLLVFFYNVTLNVNIEFLLIAMLEPILSTEVSKTIRSLAIFTQIILNI